MKAKDKTKSGRQVCVALGARIRVLRTERRWTQEQLAGKAGLHSTYIGGIERGERNLTLVNLSKLAKAFSVPLGDLFRNLDRVPTVEDADEKACKARMLALLQFSLLSCPQCKRFRQTAELVSD